MEGTQTHTDTHRHTDTQTHMYKLSYDNIENNSLCDSRKDPYPHTYTTHLFLSPLSLSPSVLMTEIGDISRVRLTKRPTNGAREDEGGLGYAAAVRPQMVGGMDHPEGALAWA